MDKHNVRTQSSGTQALTMLRLSTGERVEILSGPHPNRWGDYYAVRTAEGREHLRAEWLADAAAEAALRAVGAL